MCKMLEDMRNEAARTAAYEADRVTAEKLIKMVKLSLEEIANCISALFLNDLKKIEAEIMQMA